MKSQVLQLFALELAIGHGAEAWRVSWPRDNVNWFPPRQTHAIENRDTGISPVPTSAPQLDLFKRDDDVCGYVSGDAASTFGCLNGAYCVDAVNTHFGYSLVDCCRSADVSSCTVVTTCLDSTQSSLYPGPTSARTQFCSESDNPFCVTYSYGAGTFSGYSYFACGASKVIRTVFRSPTDGGATGGTTPTSGTSSPASSSKTTTTTAPANPAPANSDNNNGGNGSSTPVGAIVGGVVGGIAVIALLGFAIFFLVCYKKRPAHPPPAAPPVTYLPAEKPPGDPMYGNPTGGSQSVYGAGAMGLAPQDPRASTFKPSYGITEAYAPGNGHASPPPQGSSPVPPYSPSGGYTPPLQQGQYAQQPMGMGTISPQTTGAGMYGAAPLQPHQQQQQPLAYAGQAPVAHSAELPTTRGDRELQELA